VNNNLQVGHGSVDDVPSLVEVAADRFDTPDISTIQPPAAHYIIIYSTYFNTPYHGFKIYINLDLLDLYW